MKDFLGAFCFFGSVILFILAAWGLTVMLGSYLDRPIVYQSTLTGQCVKGEIKGRIVPCSQIDFNNSYEVIYVK